MIKFAVEYSKSQNSFHVQGLDEAIDKNFNAFMLNKDRLTDYVIVHLADSYEDARRICKMLMTRRDLICR